MDTFVLYKAILYSKEKWAKYFYTQYNGWISQTVNKRSQTLSVWISKTDQTNIMIEIRKAVTLGYMVVTRRAMSKFCGLLVTFYFLTFWWLHDWWILKNYQAVYLLLVYFSIHILYFNKSILSKKALNRMQRHYDKMHNFLKSPKMVCKHDSKWIK